MESSRLFPLSMLALSAAPLLLLSLVRAAQVDIHGPAGSVAFGTMVKALPNGNVVVTDPKFSTAANTNVGAVYLYSPAGEMISALTGSQDNDQVGLLGAFVLKSGDFLVLSPGWNAVAGAVTFGDANSGVGGVVSAGNSLVGSLAGDEVGSGGVVELPNGNFLVFSKEWSHGGHQAVGAVTLFPPGAHPSGPVSPITSLIGSSDGDEVGSGGATILTNGNVVILSPNWHGQYGAATWWSAGAGSPGIVSSANSLVGSSFYDSVGTGGVALANGNYVIVSPNWGPLTQTLGAVTWGNGSTGTVGVVSAGNSINGVSPNDHVGSGGVTALANGNYVICSPSWYTSTTYYYDGAVTWGDGTLGSTGYVSAQNSLTGHPACTIKPLPDGDYLLADQQWTDGSSSEMGAVTRGNGSAPMSGLVNATNSIIGSATVMEVGLQVAVLSDGNYIVTAIAGSGALAKLEMEAAATSGTFADAGSFSSTNYALGVFPLPNGRYVISDAGWSDGAQEEVGAVAWGDDLSGLSGTFSASSALVGSSKLDLVGYEPLAVLKNGNYVVASPNWNGALGAVTWAIGTRKTVGVVSAANSFVGSQAGDYIGGGGVTPLPDGNFVASSPDWSNGPAGAAGAITLGNGRFPLVGTPQPWNSVLGGMANGGSKMVYAYDPVHAQLVVGRVAENIVTVMTMDQIFGHGFEL